MNDDSIFGKYKDKESGKTSILSCRVSKETKDLFKAHAESKFGDINTGLKEILFDYMSQYPFKRQILNTGEVNIFVPVFKEDDCTRELPFDYYIDIFDFYPNDSEDINNVMVFDYHVLDYGDSNSNNPYVKDTYRDVAYWIHEETDYDLGDGVVIGCQINNYLDKNIDGIYRSFKEFDDAHRGLVIFEFEEKYYYIVFNYNLNRRYDCILNGFPYLVSNKEAFELAMECDNIELANFIDNLNDGTSNIEKNKQALIAKREKYLLQIDEIDEKLSKL